MNTRDLSLELQLFTYLRFCQGERLTAKQIRIAFLGLASQKTIDRILMLSPLFCEENGHFAAVEAVQLADLKYKFTTTANPSNVVFKISGKEGKVGSDKVENLKDVKLEGVLYLLDVKVRFVDGPPSSWTLDIKEIDVTGPGFPHKRKLIKNPLLVNGSDHRKHRTLAI